ncbi:Dbl homology domain-containing protein [Neoconidiobolus thromboides FSU 785]|nr:Dbl homology domain-containing protein [Neoconidiobolus thromboides FSU 785]
MLSSPREPIYYRKSEPNFSSLPKLPYRPNNYIQELKCIKTILHQHREKGNNRNIKLMNQNCLDEKLEQIQENVVGESNELIKNEITLNFIPNTNNTPKELKFWRDTVPKELVDSLTKNERLRQECIYETIYTEREFIKTLTLIDKAIIKPIKLIGLFNDEEFETLKLFLFHNYKKILEISETLYDKLLYIQSHHPIVENIAPAFSEWVGELEHFAYYGAHLPLAQRFLETRKSYHPEFAKFVNEMTSNSSTNYLPMLSFMNAPTTRLARMILLLNSIKKYSREDSKDFEMIPIIVDIVNKHLNVVDKSVVNEASLEF